MGEMLKTSIQFLKGVGETRSILFYEDLKITNYEDLITYYPFRHVDKSKYYKISEIYQTSAYVQIKGQFRNVEILGEDRKRRLKATFYDSTGQIECVWFKAIAFVKKQIKPNTEYIIFGKPSIFNNKLNMTHPEFEEAETYLKRYSAPFTPVYPLTERLKKHKITSKTIQKLIQIVIPKIKDEIVDYIPDEIRQKHNLISLKEALINIHFPQNLKALEQATVRLKFDELFFIQLNILKNKLYKKSTIKGILINKVGKTFNEFYSNYLPFELTGAQKRVIKEMHSDMKSGKQMNRLLQGDVGSGKTLVAMLLALIATDNNYQTALMAPTEILAQQHYKTISTFLEPLNVKISLLTGSTKVKQRREIHSQLESGEINIIIGTHALIEDVVKFHKLGLAIIDEQHRFGVAQRAKMWKKETIPPHILVMTATPIPRTLALTIHGDLDVSVIDELPPGRKPIKTLHRFEQKRPELYDFIKKQIAQGRQIYFVFPLIKESEKLDFQNLEQGYERIKAVFPPPNYNIVMVHGQMKPDEKDKQMQLFAQNKAQIMVATTVIEVGVDVPNANIMVIESSQRFGLSQLHQLRGRVGRGEFQSYCILLSPYNIGQNTRKRLEIMTQTNDGFIIADEDMKLRGPGNIDGTQQSGDPYDFKIASLARDQAILNLARIVAQNILDDDMLLSKPQYRLMKKELNKRHPKDIVWREIS